MEPPIVRLDVVDSTNTYAKEHAGDLPDGTLVSARVQTAGRGRMGRRWFSGPGRDIMATCVFKKLDRPFLAGAITGLAGLSVISEAAPELSAYLKWPNDIYVGGAKLAGLLSEAVWERGAMKCIVCGIGVNVNSGDELLSGAGQPAASLFSLTGRHFDVDFLIGGLAKAVNRHYIMCQHHPREIFARWREYNRLAGRVIEVVDPSGRSMTGLFRDVDEDGAMIFVCEGVERRFTCGDVKINASALNI